MDIAIGVVGLYAMTSNTVGRIVLMSIKGLKSVWHGLDLIIWWDFMGNLYQFMEK